MPKFETKPRAEQDNAYGNFIAYILILSAVFWSVVVGLIMYFVGCKVIGGKPCQKI